jgi:hypothetical protein
MKNGVERLFHCRYPLTPTLSHKGRGRLPHILSRCSATRNGSTPSPLVGEGWGEGVFAT